MRPWVVPLLAKKKKLQALKVSVPRDAYITWIAYTHTMGLGHRMAFNRQLSFNFYWNLHYNHITDLQSRIVKNVHCTSVSEKKKQENIDLCCPLITMVIILQRKWYAFYLMRHYSFELLKQCVLESCHLWTSASQGQVARLIDVRTAYKESVNIWTLISRSLDRRLRSCFNPQKSGWEEKVRRIVEHGRLDECSKIV